MSVTIVLDGAGLHAWAERVPPRELLVVMEVLRRHGAGRVLVPSVVTVEAFTGGPRDASLDRVLKQVDLDEVLPLGRTRLAARLRQSTTTASAVDAVVAEAAVRTRAAFLVTSDPDDMRALLDEAGSTTHVVAV